MNVDFMMRAVELAAKAKGFTSPNPCVGAVIVKGGQIVAEGYHKKAGEKHAEIVAIDALMKKAGIKTVDIDPGLFGNAELYVTLEPCSHVGKTGPCVDAVIKAGFKKVYVGMKDPNLRVNGTGLRRMKKAGVDFELVDDSSDVYVAIRDLNRGFSKAVSIGMPYVTLKAGMSLDGKIATSGGESKWITSADARLDARLERSVCDAVLVGRSTVEADDCELAAHGVWSKKPLLRVVLDSGLNLPVDAKVFRDKNVFVACTKNATKKNRDRFKNAGIEFKDFGGAKSVSLKPLLKYLSKHKGVQSLFVEGGSQVHGAFNDAGLVDRFLFYYSPRVIGGVESLAAIAGSGASSLKKTTDVRDYEISIVDSDIKIDAKVSEY